MKEKQIYICMKEGAEILGIDVRTLKKILQSAEDLHYTRLKNKILVKKEELIKYFDDHDVIKY